MIPLKCREAKKKSRPIPFQTLHIVNCSLLITWRNSCHSTAPITAKIFYQRHKCFLLCRTFADRSPHQQPHQQPSITPSLKLPQTSLCCTTCPKPCGRDPAGLLRHHPLLIFGCWDLVLKHLCRDGLATQVNNKQGACLRAAGQTAFLGQRFPLLEWWAWEHWCHCHLRPQKNKVTRRKVWKSVH